MFLTCEIILNQYLYRLRITSILKAFLIPNKSLLIFHISSPTSIRKKNFRNLYGKSTYIFRESLNETTWVMETQKVRIKELQIEMSETR